MANDRDKQFQSASSELYYYDEYSKTHKPVIEADGMLPIQSIQKKWKDSFTEPNNALNTDKWEVLQTGAGHSITILNGELNIVTGVTPNTETILQSKETFSDPFRALFGLKMTQKIINQAFYVEAVSVDPTTGIADGKCAVSWRMSGDDSLTSDYAVYETMNGGQARLASSAVDTNVSQTAYGIYELELFADEVWYHARAMDSTAGRAYSAVRHQQIPDPNAIFKVRIRALNKTTAPASSTTFSMQFVTVVDYAELTAEITSGRGNSVAGQGIYATVGGTVAVSTVTTAYVSPKSVFYADTTANVTTTTPYVSVARDTGATTNAYNTYRVRINSSHAGTLEILHGASSTATSNKSSGSWAVEANVPLVVEVPILARYIAFRFTNTGGATTTSFEAISALMGN
ncbi:hypothetical protein Q5O89_16790 [Peribacillus frigoritolerans]|nr:hypothetical protein [Peribacillus frigoritolerans]